ncbi:DNA cytosine methyltransferase [Paenibacillus sp. TC-CSREp1]|uniref:DNA cytosine methyltransferase n=1 Tax=Paenibacillus sp. TC-CSREp1 TaxID=3410089 RepID=UPI003CECB995
MIANHDPKPLSAAVAQKLSDGGYAQYIRKHPIAQLNAPCSAVVSQWAKGAPNGLVNPQGKREETMTIRNYNVTSQLPSNGLTVAEFFCGGGLMAVGLKAAGYDITFANDFDKRAAEAYAYNLGDYVVCGDITSDEIQAQIPDADIFAGGPPCQDYSVAGTGAGEKGERGKLVWTYLDIIARKQPKAFVFENVKGLITKKNWHTFDALIASFAEIGYNVSWRLINAWDYGVAQKRERVFIVGVRKDIGFTFEFPETRPEDYRTQVLRDVIGDLPEPAERKYTSVSPSRHDTPSLMDDAAKTIVASTTGGKNSFYTHALGGASNTILAHHNSGQPIHPTQAPRRFTVRECLRIQSVPDSYVLPESISLSAQYRIVGNGVASRVSYLIGVALAEQLNAALSVAQQSISEAA